VDTATLITQARSQIGNKNRVTVLQLIVTVLQGNKASINKAKGKRTVMDKVSNSKDKLRMLEVFKDNITARDKDRATIQGHMDNLLIKDTHTVRI